MFRSRERRDSALIAEMHFQKLRPASATVDDDASCGPVCTAYSSRSVLTHITTPSLSSKSIDTPASEEATSNTAPGDTSKDVLDAIPRDLLEVFSDVLFEVHFEAPRSFQDTLRSTSLLVLGTLPGSSSPLHFISATGARILPPPHDSVPELLTSFWDLPLSTLSNIHLMLYYPTATKAWDASKPLRPNRVLSFIQEARQLSVILGPQYWEDPLSDDDAIHLKRHRLFRILLAAMGSGEVTFYLLKREMGAFAHEFVNAISPFDVADGPLAKRYTKPQKGATVLHPSTWSLYPDAHKMSFKITLAEILPYHLASTSALSSFLSKGGISVRTPIPCTSNFVLDTIPILSYDVSFDGLDLGQAHMPWKSPASYFVLAKRSRLTKVSDSEALRRQQNVFGETPWSFSRGYQRRRTGDEKAQAEEDLAPDEGDPPLTREEESEEQGEVAAYWEGPRLADWARDSQWERAVTPRVEAQRPSVQVQVSQEVGEVTLHKERPRRKAGRLVRLFAGCSRSRKRWLRCWGLEAPNSISA